MSTALTAPRVGIFFGSMNAQMVEARLSSETLIQSHTVHDPGRHTFLKWFSSSVAARIGALLLAIGPIGSAAEAGEPQQRVEGSLVIVGGGALPQDVRDEFFRLAGGEDGDVVVIPTASIEADDPEKTVADFWAENRAKTVRLLHSRDRMQVEHPDFVEPLKKATGVWISGGKQARLSEAYAGTAVESALHDVVRRGGVVGGTSAGAAIMTRVTIAGGNPEPAITPGFGLFTGNRIIDQHVDRFSRDARMRRALDLHPQHVGFGIEEGTALVVHGQTGMRVVGKGKVRFYGNSRDEVRFIEPGEPMPPTVLDVPAALTAKR